MKKILGYSDRLSVAPGETVRFMVSCDGVARYRADVVRLICGDDNPKGPGFKEEVVATPVGGEYAGRKQAVHCGSYVLVPNSEPLATLSSFTLQAMIWPTTPEKGRQGLLAQWCEADKSGFALVIDETGAVALLLGDGAGKSEVIGAGKPLIAREWHFVAASYDAETKEVRVYQEPLVTYPLVDAEAQRKSTSRLKAVGKTGAPFLIAAYCREGAEEQFVVGGHYNGKIDGPRLANRALSRNEMDSLKQGSVPAALRAAIVAHWDFSRDISSDRVTDISPNRLHGQTVNLPARAMKGHGWTGTVMNWQEAPEQYGAIHFHDDDLYDAGWEADFELTVPDTMKSGVYAARLRAGEAEDYVPFFVRPRPGTATARIAFLASTATYMAYANFRWHMENPLAEMKRGNLLVLEPGDLFLYEHREFGLSLYDTHGDGSGVSYSSRLRPILNMRPKTRLWSFNADTHITDWLEAKGYAYDVVTDEDLRDEGVGLLSPYRVVVTGAHPEYWSTAMLDALDAYLEEGGRLMYLGGNGFYWRIAFHPDKPGVIEVRRAEGGMRYWEAEPGEYYQSFNGEYGGTWRRLGRPPQRVVGTGTVATGFDISSYYRRRPASFDPRAKFIFEGVGGDELIGDFGLIGGGAAGLELDGHDRALGTPPHALVVASSEAHSHIYLLAPEETPFHFPAMSGPENDRVRADMVFFECPNGGAVFSASSIAWAGSLSHDDYNNNVSRITENVMKRFLDEAAF